MASDARNMGVATRQKKFGATSRIASATIATARAIAPHETYVDVSRALRFAKNVFFIDKEICVRLWILGDDARAAHDRRQGIGGDLDWHTEHLREHLRQAAQERPAPE